MLDYTTRTRYKRLCTMSGLLTILNNYYYIIITQKHLTNWQEQPESNPKKKYEVLCEDPPPRPYDEFIHFLCPMRRHDH